MQPIWHWPDRSQLLARLYGDTIQFRQEIYKKPKDNRHGGWDDIKPLVPVRFSFVEYRHFLPRRFCCNIGNNVQTRLKSFFSPNIALN
jgi:hypothetical protein